MAAATCGSSTRSAPTRLIIPLFTISPGSLVDIADIMMDTLPIAEIEEEESTAQSRPQSNLSKFAPPKGFVNEEETKISQSDKRNRLVKFLAPGFSAYFWFPKFQFTALIYLSKRTHSSHRKILLGLCDEESQRVRRFETLATTPDGERAEWRRLSSGYIDGSSIYGWPNAGCVFFLDFLKLSHGRYP